MQDYLHTKKWFLQLYCITDGTKARLKVYFSWTDIFLKCCFLILYQLNSLGFRVPHTCAFPQFWTSLFCFCSFNSCFVLWLQIVFVGMSVGCPVWGWLSDNLGRKSVSWHYWVTMLQHCSFVNWGLNLWNDFHFQMIIISASWLFYFGFISSFSPHYFWLVALRCLVGFGIGGIPTM